MLNYYLQKEQEQRIVNDLAAWEYQVEWESDHPPEPEIKVDYSILFALQRELEELREDPEVDDLTRIKKLVKDLAPSLTGSEADRSRDLTRVYRAIPSN